MELNFNPLHCWAFTYFGANLIAALAGLYVHNLSHFDLILCNFLRNKYQILLASVYAGYHVQNLFYVRRLG